MSGDCFCQLENGRIRAYLIAGIIPDSALKKECCWEKASRSMSHWTKISINSPDNT